MSMNDVKKLSWREFCLRVFWHGGSTFDAWLNIASAKITARLFTIPQSVAQMGLPSALTFMLAQGAIGVWTHCALNSLYLKHIRHLELTSRNPRGHTTQPHEVIGGLLGNRWKTITLLFHLLTMFYISSVQFLGCSNIIHLMNDKLDKRAWVCILGAVFALSVLIPSAHNYRVWSFIGVISTIFSSIYLAIAAILHEDVKVFEVRYSTPHSYHEFYNGLSGLLLIGHVPIPIELMDAMWKPEKYKVAYGYSTVYVLVVVMFPAISMYLRFGDKLLTTPNVLTLLPNSKFRNATIVLLVIHLFVNFGMYSLALYAMWEKLLRVHDSGSYVKKTLLRLPVFLGILFTAVAFPFFGLVNRLLDSALATWNFYIIPCTAYNMVIWGGKQSLTRLGWVFDVSVNLGIIMWVVVVECALGMWGDVKAFQNERFRLFDKCYKCT